MNPTLPSFRHKAKFQRSFTLVELLIVIAVLAVIAAALVMVINPAEMLASARDSVRKRDLSNLHRSINLLRVNCPECSLGDPSVIYISIPDTSPACINLNLPSLPSPWTYSCVTSLNSRNVNGTGWMPVNFTASPMPSPLSSLPLDPVNSLENGQFYIYTAEGGAWKLTSLLESLRHARSMNTDGGPNTSLYEVGSNLNIANFQRGLVGNWGFNEGTGTTALDASGTGNTGALQLGTLGNTSPAAAWVPGVVGNALSFDGVDDFVRVLHSSSLNIANNVTVEAWVNANATGDFPHIAGKQFSTEYAYGLVIVGGRFMATMRRGPDGIISRANSDVTVEIGRWYHVTMTFSRPRLRIYVDGTFRRETIVDHNIILNTENVHFGTPDGTLAGRWFNGLIDEVRIYNRALSASEIRANFNAGRQN